MIDFPTSTRVHKRMPKEVFYRHLPLTKVLKEKFVSDVERIVVENTLSNKSLNMTAKSEIIEILLLAVSLKKQEFDGRIIEAIAKHNENKLVFLLVYEDKRKLAVYHNKLYCTQWMNEEDIDLKLKGFSLDDIWKSFTEQIALGGEQAKSNNNLSIDERLAVQDKILKLEKLVEKTEKAAWKEKQPKKKFEIYSKLQKYKQELEGLKNQKSN